MGAPEPVLSLDTVVLDLPAVAGAFSRRLHDAGVPVTAERAARFAQALALVRPVARRRLYWTARAVFVSDAAHARAFDAVFSSVFGGRGERRPAEPDEARPAEAPQAAATRDRPETLHDAAGADLLARAAPTASHGDPQDAPETPSPMGPTDEEVLRHKRFDALEPRELAQLYRLMTRLQVATPRRVTRRAQQHRRGERVDMRRTLRGSMRTAGDPIRLSRRRRRVVRRRIVLLCDISGSMEPNARAYLQFLTCAAGGGANAEAFVFATRLTRVTRALRTRSPQQAIQRVAASAPDWSSGTRIGDALKEFNDRHGRRGMARGAIVVILSDGWERGDPAVVGREMERLARLAYRIVWVNPRVGATGFVPRAGGMVAALEHCDALVSGHSLAALDEVAEAIGARRGTPAAWAPAPAPPEPEEEPWASATPVAGSSVAMPSGYGPSRGKTTPGWSR